MTSALRMDEGAPVSAPAYHVLVARAEERVATGRVEEGTALLRQAIALEPRRPAAWHALLLAQADSGRDLEAFATCASMLESLTDAESLRLGAELLLFLHIRHATLLSRQDEPVRLDFRAIGVDEVPPMALAREFLPRARALARAAAHAAPRDAIAQATLAEAELRAGNASAARRAAETAVRCAPIAGPLVARALAALADFREAEGIRLLREPALVAFAPSLAQGEVHALRVDGACAPETARTRAPWTIPYEVQVADQVYARTVTVRTAPPVLRAVPGARVVGGLFAVLDDRSRALLHGVVDEPDVHFVLPRCHDVPTVLSHGVNTVLRWANDRLVLHVPGAERAGGGRAVLLASNVGGNYYHWFADVLGRLTATPDVLEDPDVSLVVAPMLPFQRETLAMLGVDPSRCVEVGPREVMRFDELLVAQHRKDGGCTDRTVWHWLRERFADQGATAGPGRSRKVYLRRGPGAMRGVVNEPEVEAIVREAGFEVVETARRSVAEQRALFAEVSEVVAPVGASLTNLVFSPPGVRTVLFGQRGYVVPCYNALAESLGHTVRYVLGREQQSPHVYPHWDYVVDLESLRRALG